jgi:uncharacterized protein (DUF2267 family)
MATATGVRPFDSSLETTWEWPRDAQEQMGLDDEQRAFRVLRAVFTVLERHMPGGEIDEVESILPEAIRELWP